MEQKTQTKQPTTKQPVYITEDLKAVIRTNNGVIDSAGNSHATIGGHFFINADSVTRLSAALQGKNIYTVRVNALSGVVTGNIVTSDKGIKTTIDNLNKDIESKNTELRALNDQLAKAERKYSKLVNELKLFNSNRRFWERKIEIPE